MLKKLRLENWMRSAVETQKQIMQHAEQIKDLRRHLAYIVLEMKEDVDDQTDPEVKKYIEGIDVKELVS